MCGISGFNWKDEQKIRQMVPCISYRGPDAEEVFVDEGVSLGHNRLAIIDLSAEANQPMFDAAGEFVIVFNGEIYNFGDLKRELEAEYLFKTKSDTEVILAGYRKWGAKVAERLNGMFALAIWDKRDQSLFCARDHAGMKPFYYFWDGKRFIFASEIPAILTHDVPRKLNREALNHFFRILYAPEPMTLFENIYKLPPAHTLTLKNGELSISSYESSVEPAKISYEDAVKEVKEKVQEAVERHLIADVPIGVYLSGGIDSSVVLAAMSKLRGNIKTFTIGFDLGGIDSGEKFNQDFNLAQRTAEFFGTEHYPLVVSTRAAAAAFEEVAAHNSDPISNPTSIAMLLLAKHARKHVTVALTGNSGDELFGGYERYRKALWARFVLGRENLFARFMFEKDPKLKRFISKEFFKPDSEIKPYYRKYLAGRSAPEALMNADRQSWLPDHFFMLSDKMSMTSALEERMPLADLEVSKLAKSLPRSYKFNLSGTKKVLKDAFKGDLPEFLFDQPKRGWFSPAAKWFRDPEFADLARKILSPEYYEGTKELFNWSEVSKMLMDHIEKREYNLTSLWAIMTFQTWAKRFKVHI